MHCHSKKFAIFASRAQGSGAAGKAAELRFKVKVQGSRFKVHWTGNDS